MLGAIGLLGLLLVWPIGQVLVLGFLDAQTLTNRAPGQRTMADSMGR